MLNVPMIRKCTFTNGAILEDLVQILKSIGGEGHGGTVLTHLPPTSEVSGSNSRPYVGKLLFLYRWSAVYSIEP